MRSSVITAVFLVSAACLSGCSDEYPLVANGYAKTADLSALDNQGRGNFALPVEPQGCLLAFQAMPDLSTLQVRVYIENEVDRTYSSAELAQALDNADFSKGVFVVDDSGIRFENKYKCESEKQ